MKKLNENELREIAGGRLEIYGDASDTTPQSDHSDAGGMKDGAEFDGGSSDVADGRTSDVSDR